MLFPPDASTKYRLSCGEGVERAQKNKRLIKVISRCANVGENSSESSGRTSNLIEKRIDELGQRGFASAKVARVGDRDRGETPFSHNDS